MTDEHKRVLLDAAAELKRIGDYGAAAAVERLANKRVLGEWWLILPASGVVGVRDSRVEADHFSVYHGGDVVHVREVRPLTRADLKAAYVQAYGQAHDNYLASMLKIAKALGHTIAEDAL